MNLDLFLSFLLNALLIGVALLVFYCTGALLFRFRQLRDAPPSFVVPAVGGMLFWVMLTALLNTGGVSVLWLLLPVLLVATAQTFSAGFAGWRELLLPLRRFVWPLAIAVLLFAAKSVLLWDYERLIPDHAFYARIVAALGQTGQENEFHFLVNASPNYSGVSPYHYGELWLANLFTVLPAVLPQQAFLQLATPLLTVLLLLAVYELLSGAVQGRLLRTRAFGIALLLLGCSWPLVWPLSQIGALRQFEYVFFSPLCYDTAKFVLPALLVAWAALLYRNTGQFRLFLLVLATLPVISYTTLPAVVGGIFSTVLLRQLQQNGFKHLFRKRPAVDLLPLLLPLAVLVFYTVVHVTSMSRAGVSLSEAVVQGEGVFKNMLKVMVAGGVAIVAFLLPLLVVVAVIARRRWLQLSAPAGSTLVFVLAGLFSGAAAWGLLNVSLNSIQLLSILAGGIAVAVAAALPEWLATAKPMVARIGSAVLFLLLVAGGVSTVLEISKHRRLVLAGRTTPEFEQTVGDCIERASISRIGFAWPTAAYQSPFVCYPHFSVPMPELVAKYPSLLPVSLGEMNRTPVADAAMEAHCQAGIRMGLLWYFCKQQSSAFSPTVALEDEELLGFCREHHLEYVLLCKEAKLFANDSLLEVLATDKNTGLRLMRLR